MSFSALKNAHTLSSLKYSSLLIALIIAAGLFLTACDDDTVSPDGEQDATLSDAGFDATDDTGTPSECDEGYVGQDCELCDEENGYRSDGQGGCLLSLCDPDPCASHPNRECVADGGQARCVCTAGTHEEDGECVLDTTCGPDSCNGHGSCDDSGDAIACSCDEGFGGELCGECDTANGYHDDGQGGCTQDPCTPNPCSETNRGTCVADEDTYVCECDAGFHDDNGQCVVDATCETNSCSGNGTCDDSTGVVDCACDAGFVGDVCDQCDTANGYHDDGQGGCTQDPCLPNQCTDANKTQCSPDANTTNGYVCGCDPGYHDDGVGNCTQDPCLPNPCASQNEACRQAQTSTGYECYVPTCDDQNPCTDDTVVNGVCTYTDRADGVSCSTSVCVQGETCSSGQCGGGSAVVCDDNNPCTQDSCDPVAGCGYVADDGLIPDDGIACTTDTCSGGAQSHTADDTYCDDGLWCSGVETCSPSSSEADADGCIVSNVPQPPSRPYSPCAYYGACDESTQSFTLITEPVGSSCDDGIACTSSDQCTSSGACAGTVSGDCGLATCNQTSPVGTSVEISTAAVTGTVTVDGGALPQTSPSSYTLLFYLKAKDTGKLHGLHRIDYAYQSGSPDYLLNDSTSFDTLVVPGVYDLVYSRALNSSDRVWTTTTGDSLPNGYRILSEGVVVGQGVNELDIDIPSASVAGTVTVDGGALPQTSPSSYTLLFYLKAKDTGKLHGLHRIDYAYQSGSPDYLLNDSTSYDTLLPAGTYDLVYSRALNSSDRVWTTSDGDTIPNGFRVLQSDVVLGSGSNTLDIDLDGANVSGTVTIDGAQLPQTSPSSYTLLFYLKAKDTGKLHGLHRIDYAYQSGSPDYLLNDSPSYDTLLPAGTYDLVYSRGLNSSDRVWTTSDGDTIPNGYRVLQSDVVLGSGSNTLDIDLEGAGVSGTVTIDGAQLPQTSPSSYTLLFYLKAKDTGKLHGLHRIDYAYQSGSPDYLLNDSPSYDTLVPAGNYDLVYSRALNSSDRVWTTSSGDTIPNGYRVLASNIALTAASNTLDIDLGSADVSGTVTVDGAQLPQTSPSSYTLLFYLKAQDTGKLHGLHRIDYAYQSGSPDYLLDDSPSYDTRLPAGTYDLVYSRALNPSDRVWTTSGGDTIPNGYRLLQADITIGTGSNTLNIDVSSATVASEVTLDGNALPQTSPSSYTLNFYLQARDTGKLHGLHRIDYAYQSGSPDYLLNDPATFSTLLPSGTYDLLYSRALNSSDRVWTTTGGDTIPNGYRYLQMCVEVP